MKNILLIALFLSVQVAFGQQIIETRTAVLNNGDYSLEGTVHLELFDDNSLQLRFDSNYLTQSNVFDVHVFLTNDNNYNAPIDISEMLQVANIGTISGLNYSSGPMTFTLPSNVDINDYQYIVFVCVQFGRLHWGNGIFEESVVLTNTADIESANEVAVAVYPNPSTNEVIEILFQELQQNIVIEVFRLNGQLVSTSKPTFSNGNQHLVELRGTGTFFIKITTDMGSTIKKIIRL